jgi:hypothetical protein
MKQYVSPHKKPTPRQTELLHVLIEECAEVQKAATKLLRFGAKDHDPYGDGKTNDVCLSEELGQLEAVSVMLQSRGIVLSRAVLDGYGEKCNKLPKYLQTEEDE